MDSGQVVNAVASTPEKNFQGLVGSPAMDECPERILSQASPDETRGEITGPLTGLARVLIAVVVASFASILVMLGVFSSPQSDPLDVVGLSLMLGFNGYSETAERNAFYAFVISLVVLGPLVALASRRLTAGRVESLGVTTLWILLVIFCGKRHLEAMLALGLVLGILTLLGRVAALARLGRDAGAFPGWTLVVCAWGAYQQYCHKKFGTPATFVESMIIPGIVTMAILCHYAPNRFSKFFPLISVATAVILVFQGDTTFWPRGILIAGCALVCSNPEAAWNGAKRIAYSGLRGTFADRVSVWVAVALVAWILQWVPKGSVAFTRITVEALLCGLLLQMGRIRVWAYLNDHGWIILFQKAPQTLPRFLIEDRVSKWLVPTVILTMGMLSGWFATRVISGWISIGISVLCAGVAWRFHRQLPGAIRNLLLTAGLAIACWPNSPFYPVPERSRLDEFHDGQIMSAIWEIEQGRPLITEVFPLRSTEVYLGWIARRFLGPTMQAAHCPWMLRSPVLAAGACLIGYAWTRSAFWSVLFGLLALPGVFQHYAGLREGLLLITLGAALEIVRCRDSRWWLLLVPLGAIPLLAGFDVGASYLAAIGAATLCGNHRRFHLFEFVRGGVWAVMIVGFTVLCFSTGLTAVSGISAARDYWLIMFDFSKHYTAFYGLPIGYQWIMTAFIFKALIGLAWFAAGGAIVWPQMTARTRRQWALLLVAVVMFAHRGLGRSSEGHLNSAAFPMIVIWAIIIYEMLRRISGERRLISASQFQLVAPCVVIALVWQAPVRDANLIEFCRQMRHFPTQETVLRTPDPRIEALVKPDEYIWPVDNGIVNFEQQRHNPTRHAIAYCIGSPKEQRRAARDLERHPTPIISWRWAPFDGVDPFVRYPGLANYVLRNYRPASGLLLPYTDHYVVRAEPDWLGCDDSSIADGFLNVCSLQRLPYIWGERRWPILSPRVKSTRDYAPWTPVASEPGQLPQSRFLAKEEIVPREWNYVLLEFAMNEVKADAKDWPIARLEFAEGESFAKFFEISWECVPDGKTHRYLIPVGCHTGWTWKSHIRQLRLSSDRGRITVDNAAHLADIDELRDHD